MKIPFTSIAVSATLLICAQVALAAAPSTHNRVRKLRQSVKQKHIFAQPSPQIEVSPQAGAQSKAKKTEQHSHGNHNHGKQHKH